MALCDGQPVKDAECRTSTIQLTKQQQYEKVVETFTSWINWEKDVDWGLMLGLGDYYMEIRILEDELNVPKELRFDFKKVMNGVWKDAR